MADRGLTFSVGSGDDVYPLIAEAIRRFADTREGSARTAATYKHCLQVFARFLQDECGIDTASIGTEALTSAMPAEFYSWLTRRYSRHGTAYAPLTARLYTSAVRSLMLDLSLLDRAPGVDIPRMTALLRRRLPRDEYPYVDPGPYIPTIAGHYDLQSEPPNEQGRLVQLRNSAVMHTLYSTAMRVSECAGLRRSQVAGARDECAITGKGGVVRRVYFTERSRVVVARYLDARGDENPYLFVSHGRGPSRRGVMRGARVFTSPFRPLSAVRIWSIVHDAAVACGAPDVHPHVFRHYRASRWLTDGMPLELVQELLGHRDVSVTRRVYAHYLGSAVKDAFFRHEESLDAKSVEPRQDDDRSAGVAARMLDKHTGAGYT